MKLRRLPNGNFLIPVGVYRDDISGDAFVEIDSSDQPYAEWEPFVGSEWDETVYSS
jgi:hypothetical protein